MREVKELLKQKELEFQKLSQEIDAIRLTLRLLEDAGAGKSSAGKHAAAASGTTSSVSLERNHRVTPIQPPENGHGVPAEAGLQFP